MEDNKNIPKRNIGMVRENLPGYVRAVETTGKPMIIQRNNVDVAVIAPLELLRTKKKERTEK